MKIPIALRRRIPVIRRQAEPRDQTLAELAAVAADRDRCGADLEHLHRRVAALAAELEARPARRGPKDPVIVSIPDPDLGYMAQRVLGLLRPMNVVGGTLARKGRDNDGGYVMLEYGLDNAIAYSLGIKDDVSWDLDLAARGCQIYQYDHTIDRLPFEHPNFRWFRIGIAAQSSADGVMSSLGDLMMRNGHHKRQDIIVKMDIEGAEWDVFDAMDQATLQQLSQIVVEMHNFAVRGHDLLPQIVSVLHKLGATHQPIHVHANNWGYLGLIGGTMIPDTLEVTYVRRADHSFEECKKVFPTSLDMPCNPSLADYFLGPLGALPTTP